MLYVGSQSKSGSQPLPASLVRARQVKAVGTKASAAVLGLGLCAACFQGIDMPSPAQWSITGLASVICVGAVLLGLAVTRDQAQVELHQGRVYIQWGAPSTGPPLSEGAVEVKPMLSMQHMVLLLASNRFTCQQITTGYMTAMSHCFIAPDIWISETICMESFCTMSSSCVNHFSTLFTWTKSKIGSLTGAANRGWTGQWGFFHAAYSIWHLSWRLRRRHAR